MRIGQSIRHLRKGSTTTLRTGGVIIITAVPSASMHPSGLKTSSYITPGADTDGLSLGLWIPNLRLTSGETLLTKEDKRWLRLQR